MKKKLTLTYFIFIFLFSFNQVIAEECDFEFQIGDDASKAIFLYGEPISESDSKIKVDRGYSFIEEFLKNVYLNLFKYSSSCANFESSRM